MTYYNTQAEQIVLGMLLERNDLIGKVKTLKPADFHTAVHGEIYGKMQANYQNDIPSNPVTLRSDFEAHQDLAELGGINYLLKVCQEASGHAGLGTYTAIVKEESDKRLMLQIFNAQIASLRSKKSKDVLTELNKNLSEMQASTSDYRLIEYCEIMESIAKDIQESPNGRIYSTGLPRVDISMNGGMEPGKMYCIQAPPKFGKTMLKGTISNYLRKNGTKFLFVAAEMSAQQLAKRMIATDLDLRVKDLNKDNAEYVSYLTKHSMKRSNNMFFLNAPRIPLPALITSIINAKKSKGIEGVVIDYLQLVSGKPRGMSLVEHQDEVAYTVAEIGKKEDLWILCSCQQNRKGEVRNGDGILQAVEWIYELDKFKMTGSTDERVYANLKHVGTREFGELDIGTSSNPLFELSPNGTHFIHMDK